MVIVVVVAVVVVVVDVVAVVVVVFVAFVDNFVNAVLSVFMNESSGKHRCFFFPMLLFWWSIL